LLKPNTSVQFMKLGMLSPDGACKAFDVSGKTLVQKVACCMRGTYCGVCDQILLKQSKDMAL